MSKHATVKITLIQDCEFKQLFLKDPKSDIFIILENRIIPLHKAIITKCSYFKDLPPTEKVYFMRQPINPQAFQKVIACLYGHPLQFRRTCEGTTKIIQAVMILQIQELISFFLQDFESNFDEYGIFTLYGIALKYNLSWLEKKCIQELVSCSFQQFQINKYDLLNNDKKTLQQILHHYVLFKSEGLTERFEDEKVRCLIEQYSIFNSTRIDPSEILSSTANDQKHAGIINDFYFTNKKSKSSKLQIRKRKSTWGHPSENHFPEVNNLKTVNKSQMRSSNRLNRYQSQYEAKQLEQINSLNIKRANTILAQIKQTQQMIRTQSNNQQNQRMQNIETKLCEFAKTLKKQQEKISRIKKLANQILSNSSESNFILKRY